MRFVLQSPDSVEPAALHLPRKPFGVGALGFAELALVQRPLGVLEHLDAVVGDVLLGNHLDDDPQRRVQPLAKVLGARRVGTQVGGEGRVEPVLRLAVFVQRRSAP